MSKVTLLAEVQVTAFTIISVELVEANKPGCGRHHLGRQSHHAASATVPRRCRRDRTSVRPARHRTGQHQGQEAAVTKVQQLVI